MLVKGYSKIAGAGQCIPNEVVLSDDLMREVKSERFGFKENFISRIVGIEERRITRDQDQFDLALIAAREAVETAKIDPLDIDLVLYTGIEQIYCEPSTAHIIQRSIGAKNASCFDISNACLGLMSGIMTANAFIGAGGVENVLVCSGEKGSLIIEETIRALKRTKSKERFNRLVGGLTVGDAGGAFVITKKTGNTGFNYFNTMSNGEMAELCWYRHEGNKLNGQMDIGKISGACISAHQALIEESYQAMGWTADCIDSLSAHQVGKRMHRQHASTAGIDTAIAANTHKYLGNVASVTLAPAAIANQPKQGHNMLLMASASGISVAQAGHTFDKDLATPSMNLAAVKTELPMVA